MPPTSVTDEQPLPDDVAGLKAMLGEVLKTNREQARQLWCFR